MEDKLFIFAGVGEDKDGDEEQSYNGRYFSNRRRIVYHMMNMVVCERNYPRTKRWRAMALLQ